MTEKTDIFFIKFVVIATLMIVASNYLLTTASLTKLLSLTEYFQAALVAAPNNPAPTINALTANPSGLVPSSAVAGGSDFTLIVNGTNFVNGYVVKFNGMKRGTIFVSPTQLTASIPSSAIISPTTVLVIVSDSSGTLSSTSNSRVFTINNPVPTITDMSPQSVTVSGPTSSTYNFTLTVDGTGFVSNNSQVKLNGSTKTTTFNSSTQLTARILASDIATVGAKNITVFNPTPGGGTSSTRTLTVINNPVPAITYLFPTSVSAGALGFNLSVNGSNFVPSSKASFNNVAKTTVFVNSNRLLVPIPALYITTAKTFSIGVTNPAPGGGTSNGINFTVTP